MTLTATPASGVGSTRASGRVATVESWTSASSPNPNKAPATTIFFAVAQRTESLGFRRLFRSDHYVKMGGVSGLPGPTDAWLTLAALARDTSRVRLGTLVTSATFRLPGPLAISVAQVDQMSGGRVELGLGAGWFGEGARGLRHPFPSTVQRRPVRGTVGDHHRALVDARERDVLLRRRALHPDRLPALPKPAVTAADHHRRPGQEAHACTGGPLRHRVQRGVPTGRRHDAPVPAG